MQDIERNKEKSLTAYLESLTSEYEQLLTQAIATWLFLECSNAGIHGSVEWSVVQKPWPFTLLQYLPCFNTVHKDCLINTAASPGNTSLISTDFAEAAQCGNDKIFPTHSTLVAKKYQAGNKKASIHTLNMEVFLKKYRAQCQTQLNNIAEQCQNITETINQLLAQQLPENSLLHKRFVSMLRQFHTLNDCVNDPECLAGYTEKLSALLTQLYIDIEQFTVQTLKSESMCEGRNQLWLLSSEVDFWTSLFIENNLRFCEYLNYALAHDVVFQRELIEMNLLRLRIRLNYITSENRIENREQYFQQVQGYLAQKESFARLLIAASNSKDLSTHYADILTTYYNLQNQLSYIEILNSEYINTVKKSLFTVADNGDTKPAQGDTQLSAIEVDDFLLCRELAFIASVTVGLPVIEKPSKPLSPDEHNQLLTLLKSHIEQLNVLKMRADSCHLRQNDPDLSAAHQGILSILQNKANEISELIQSFIRSLSRNANRIGDSVFAINRRFSSEGKSHESLVTDLLNPGTRSETISLVDLLVFNDHIAQTLSDADILLNCCVFYSNLPKEVLEQSTLYAESLAQLQKSHRVLSSWLSAGINKIQTTLRQWQYLVDSDLTATEPSSIEEVFEQLAQLNSLLLQKESLIRALTGSTNPLIQSEFAHSLQWLNSLECESVMQKIKSLSTCKVVNEFIKNLKAKVDCLIEKTKKPPVLQSQLLIFTYYIAMLKGQVRPNLATEVYGLNNKTSEIHRGFQSILDTLTAVGGGFTVLKTNNPEIDQLVKFISLSADKSRALNYDYANLYSLIEEHINHTTASRNKAKENAISMLQNFLQRVLESSNKSKDKFDSVLNAIRKACQSTDSADIESLLTNLKISNQQVSQIELWIETLNDDTTHCTQFTREIQELLEKSASYETALGSRLTEISITVFQQVKAQFESKIRRNQLLIDQLKDKCSLQILSEYKM